MSSNFDWKTEEDFDWDDLQEDPPPKQSPGKKRRWFTILVIILLLSGLGAFLYYQVDQRIDNNTAAMRSDVISSHNLLHLAEIEQETGGRINTILQLRLHPAIKALKKEVDAAPGNRSFEIDLTYITSRGLWYDVSWKGDIHKSGGVANNIGIHFFDMLTWIFGPVKQSVVHLLELRKAAGFLELERGRVRWFLSLDHNDLPFEPEPECPRTYRSITVDGREIDFLEGFTELHTTSYEQIFDGNGFRLDEVKPAIQIVADIRNIQPVGLEGDYHPMLAK